MPIKRYAPNGGIYSTIYKQPSARKGTYSDNENIFEGQYSKDNPYGFLTYSQMSGELGASPFRSVSADAYAALEANYRRQAINWENNREDNSLNRRLEANRQAGINSDFLGEGAQSFEGAIESTAPTISQAISDNMATGFQLAQGLMSIATNFMSFGIQMKDKQIAMDSQLLGQLGGVSGIGQAILGDDNHDVQTALDNFIKQFSSSRYQEQVKQNVNGWLQSRQASQYLKDLDNTDLQQRITKNMSLSNGFSVEGMESTWAYIARYSLLASKLGAHNDYQSAQNTGFTLGVENGFQQQVGQSAMTDDQVKQWQNQSGKTAWQNTYYRSMETLLDDLEQGIEDGDVYAQSAAIAISMHAGEGDLPDQIMDRVEKILEKIPDFFKGKPKTTPKKK